MQLSFTFKNIEPSEALKDYVSQKLERLDKFFHKPTEARIVFSVEKDNHIAEISLRSSKLSLQAREASENMNSSIDIVVDKLKVQMSKYMDKIQARRPKTKTKASEISTTFTP